MISIKQKHNNGEQKMQKQMTDLTIQNEWLRNFDMGLEKLRYELQTNLAKIDLLEQEPLIKTLKAFDQRLVIFQYEFLNALSQNGHRQNTGIRKIQTEVPDSSIVPEVTTTILTGLASSILLSLPILTVTTGMLFWTSTTSIAIATMIGTAVGVPATVVTAGGGVALGVGAGIAVHQFLKNDKRKKIETAIDNALEQQIFPVLRQWAKKQMA